MLFPRFLRNSLLFQYFQLRSLRVWGNIMQDNKCKTTEVTGQFKYLTQSEAIALDQDLFNTYKYSVDQLMELAGLSVATAVARVYPPDQYRCPLIICGPGNNGGDGLVAARHMTHFGYNVTLHYPKRTPKPLYENLFSLCKSYNICVLDCIPPPEDMKQTYNLLVDALFGFSFKPPVREDLSYALHALSDSELPVCSVDIPSGWDVETGPGQSSLKPSMLVSLSAPKACAKPEHLQGAIHYLGGRFLPPGIIKKYNLNLPPYPGQEQIVQLAS